MNFETENLLEKYKWEWLKNEKLFSCLLLDLFLDRALFSEGKNIEVVLTGVTNYALLIPRHFE